MIHTQMGMKGGVTDIYRGKIDVIVVSDRKWCNSYAWGGDVMFQGFLSNLDFLPCNHIATRNHFPSTTVKREFAVCKWD